MYILRQLGSLLASDIQAGQSVLLLGPRQTGKTTLIEHLVRGKERLFIANLLRARDRDRYSSDPDALIDEVSLLLAHAGDEPVWVVVDEIQRVPRLVDALQLLIDEHKGKVVAILSGSSARKLRRGQVNLLPGRVVERFLLPLSSAECRAAGWTTQRACRFGRLPGIVTAPSDTRRRELLETYVATYLQEEVREEALVRNYGAFRTFLSEAAERSGEEVRYERLAGTSRVTGATIRNHYGILLDTLLAFEVRPINLIRSLPGCSPRRESKTSKIYLFDNGIVSAIRGRWKLSPAEYGKALEHLALLDLLAVDPRRQIGFWRQHEGHEVDFVVIEDDGLTGIKVKATRQPGKRDLRGLHQLHKIHGLRKAVLVCEIDRPMDLKRQWASLDATLAPPETVVAVPVDNPISSARSVNR